MLFLLEIENCSKCPKCKTERALTADSFEDANNYFCGENNHKIAEYVEWNDDLPEVPDWCPHLVK